MRLCLRDCIKCVKTMFARRCFFLGRFRGRSFQFSNEVTHYSLIWFTGFIVDSSEFISRSAFSKLIMILMILAVGGWHSECSETAVSFSTYN